MMPKQQWVYFVCFAFMSTAIIWPVSVLAADIAQVVFDPAHLNGREETVRDSLLAWQYSVTLIDTANATYENLAAYTATVATDNGHLDSSVINALITNGRGVAMLYSAGKAYGGTWYHYNSNPSANRLCVEAAEGFLADYTVGDTLTMQSSNTCCINGGITAWNSIGHNLINTDYKTALYKEVVERQSDTTRAAIHTYHPFYYTSMGYNVFNDLILWLGGLVPTFEKKVEDCLPADIPIYPNPVSNRLHLNLNIKEKTVFVMKIYDIEGRFVSGITQEITNPGHFQKECDIRTLPAGVYFIQISVNDRQICKKIIVTR